MEVRAHDDPSAWLEAVLPLLMLDEARHDLCLGLVHTLVHHPSVYPSKYLWSVEDAGTVVGAALQTPPHNLILGQPSAEGANDLLADAIESAGIQLPGVVGGLPEAERSEEHTSELQSHHDLVCRLLLEKKKHQ